ncbi:MAG: hypothetical protein GY913_18375 [Proteobacteria bacterium]|nr:hypothetical protein [Pseudomonadota bacterium]MCP4918876.1 hypothetical protein [Pseudomonadota bacterium]
MSLLTLLLLACQPDPESWHVAADCESLSDAAVQDECWLKVSVEVAKTDQAAGEALVDKIQDPLVKDYAWHSLTRDVDPTSYKYCEKIENDKLADRCRVLVSRPHLHPHLIGDGAADDPRPPGGGKGPAGPDGGKGPPPGENGPPPEGPEPKD